MAHKREAAWRLFAEEFNASRLEIKGEGEYTPSYIVTPLGALVNRMFVVGVLTDVENIGSGEEPLYRARVVDPTGTFYVSAGQYQPEAAKRLASIKTPAAAGWRATSGSSMPIRGMGCSGRSKDWRRATSTPKARNVPSDMFWAENRQGFSSPATSCLNSRVSL